MRNYGVIRSSATGEVLRLAPNFDNNQAFLANPGNTYSDRMLRLYMKEAGLQDRKNLKTLSDALKDHPYLKDAYKATLPYLE